MLVCRRSRRTGTVGRNGPRAKIILATADGPVMNAMMCRVGLSKPCVWRWQERVPAEGVDGLLRDKTRPSRVPPFAQATTTRGRADPDRAVTRGHALDGRMPWRRWPVSAPARCGGFGARTGWSRTGSVPSSSRRTGVRGELRDIVGLYVAPPAHAVVLSMDERPQIQALDRTSRVCRSRRAGLPR